MQFSITLSNVLMTLFYMVPGFILRKMNAIKEDHLPSLSALLVYIGSVFMQVSAYSTMERSIENLALMGIFFAVCFLMQILFMLVLFLLFHKKYEQSKYRVLTMASVMGNFGFFGLPVIRGLFPDNPEVACYSQIYVIAMNILIFTVGVYCLTGDKKYISLKSAFCNPTVLGFTIGMICYLTRLYDFFPVILTNGINLVGNMMTPLCMIIVGVRLASVKKPKSLFTNGTVYAISTLKLLVYPVFCFLLIWAVPLDPVLKSSLVVLSGTPCAAVILGLAEIHHSETEISANCILLTTLLSIVTLPVISLLINLF